VHFTPPKQEGKCDRCGATLVHRDDDKPDTVRRRLVVYRDQTAPLIEWYGRSGAQVVPWPRRRAWTRCSGAFRKAVGR